MTRPRHLHASVRRRDGFTLIELLVVLGLIVLALAAAVPAFNAITGSRSTDAAENMVSAMLQRARALAIQERRITGVLFFLNPRDQRATMALVTKQTSTSGGLAEDLYDNYRGWTRTSWQQNTTGTGLIVGGPPYSEGQEVIALYHRDYGTTFTQDDNERYRHMTRAFTRDESSANTLPNNNNPGPLTTPGTPEGSPSPWEGAGTTSGTGVIDTHEFDFVADTAFETLPAGVAAQTINDPKGHTRDRYLQIGLVIFDADGRLISLPYSFKQGSQIFNLLAKSPPGTNQTPPSSRPDGSDIFYSQLGLVLYDRSTFLNQPGATEGDPAYQRPGFVDVFVIPGPAAAGQEGPEETWIDNNTTPLFVNRGNGTLLKGQ